MCRYFGTFEGDVPCSTRNICFTVVGYLVMLLSNSAAGNAGVDKSFDMTPTPVLHVAGDRTKDAVSSLIKGSKIDQKNEVVAKANEQLTAPLIGGQASGGTRGSE